MTDAEWQDLIDLYVVDALPEALRCRVQDYLSQKPSATHDADTQSKTLALLQAAQPERPEAWFVEHALDSLLRDHASATTYDQTMTNTRS